MNENVVYNTDDEIDKRFLLLENKNLTINGKDNAISPAINQNSYGNQPRTLKSRQLLDVNVSTTMNLIDVIEEDEQEENGEIQNINHNSISDKLSNNKEDKQLIFRFPSMSGNQQEQSRKQLMQSQITQGNSNGFTPIIPNRSSSKRNTETQFTIPTLYRSNTTKSDHQNNNGSTYSNHNQYQNTLVPSQHMTQTQEDQIFQELLNQNQSQNQMSPNSFKRSAMKAITKKLMNAQKMYDSNHRQGEKKLSKLIHFDELASPTSSIKQQFSSGKKITTEKIVTKLMQSKTANQESKNLDMILKQIQQLVANQQNFEQLQQQLEQSNNNYHPVDGDLFTSFDRMKSFVKYNPRYNFSSVISRYNQFLDAKRKKNKVKKGERAGKTKGTQYTKQSQKNLELVPQLDQRKFSKFSPINLHNKMNHIFQDGIEQNLQNPPQTSQRLCGPDSESPNNFIQKEKEYGLKLEIVQNQTTNNIDSMNQLKMSNASQNYVASPNQTQRDPLIISHKTIEFKRNNSFTIEDKESKSTSYNVIGINNKYGSSNKEETVDEDINSPSLHVLPNNFDMRFSNIGQRSLYDYENKYKN